MGYKNNNSSYTLIDIIDKTTQDKIGDYIYSKNSDYRYSLKNTIENLYFETERSYKISFNENISSFIENTNDDYSKIEVSEKIENPNNYNEVIRGDNGFYYSLDSSYGKKLALEEYKNNNKIYYYDEDGNNYADYYFYYNSFNNQFYVVNNFVNGEKTIFYKYTTYIDSNKNNSQKPIYYSYNNEEYQTYPKKDSAYTLEVGLDATNPNVLEPYFVETNEIKNYFVIGVSKDILDKLNLFNHTLKYAYNEETNKMEVFCRTINGDTLIEKVSNYEEYLGNYSFLISDADYEMFNSLCKSQFKFKLNDNMLVFTEYGLYKDTGYFIEGSYLGTNPTKVDKTIEGYYYTVQNDDGTYSLQTSNQLINGLYSENKYAYTEINNKLYLMPDGTWTFNSQRDYYIENKIVYYEPKQVFDYNEYTLTTNVYEKDFWGEDWIRKTTETISEEEYKNLWAQYNLNNSNSFTHDEYQNYEEHSTLFGLIKYTTYTRYAYTITITSHYRTENERKEKIEYETIKINNLSIVDIIEELKKGNNNEEINAINTAKNSITIPTHNVTYNNKKYEVKEQSYNLKNLFLIVDDSVQTYKLYNSQINSITVADVTDTDILDLTQYNSTESLQRNNTYRLRWDNFTVPNENNYGYYANSSIKLFGEETNQYVYSNGNIYQLEKVQTEQEFYDISTISSYVQKYLYDFKKTLDAGTNYNNDSIDWGTMMYGSFYGQQVNTQSNGFSSFIQDVGSALVSFFTGGDGDNNKTHPIGYVDEGDSFWGDKAIETDASYFVKTQIDSLDVPTQLEEIIKLYFYLVHDFNSDRLHADEVYEIYKNWRNKSDDDRNNYLNNLNFHEDEIKTLKALFSVIDSAINGYIIGQDNSKWVDYCKFLAILSPKARTKRTIVQIKNMNWFITAISSPVLSYNTDLLLQSMIYSLSVKTEELETADFTESRLLPRYNEILNSSKLNNIERTRFINVLNIFANNYTFKKNSIGFSYQKYFTIQYYKTLFSNIENIDTNIDYNEYQKICKKFFDIDINAQFDLQKVHQLYEFYLNYTKTNVNIYKPDSQNILVINNENSKLIYYKTSLTTGKVTQYFYRTDDGFAFNQYLVDDEIKQVTLETILNGKGHQIYKYDITDNIIQMMKEQETHNSGDSNNMKQGNYYMETWITSPEFLHAYNYCCLLENDNYMLITNYDIAQKNDSLNKLREKNIAYDDFYITETAFSKATFQTGNIHPIGVVKTETYSYKDTYVDFKKYENLNKETISNLLNNARLNYKIANFEDEKKKIMNACLVEKDLTVKKYMSLHSFWYISTDGSFYEYDEKEFETFDELLSLIVEGKVYVKDEIEYASNADAKFYSSLPKTKIYYYSKIELDITSCNFKVCSVGSVTAANTEPAQDTDFAIKTWLNTYSGTLDSSVWAIDTKDFFGDGYRFSTDNKIALYTKTQVTAPFIKVTVGLKTSLSTGLSTSSIINAKNNYYVDTTLINSDIYRGYYFINPNGEIITGNTMNINYLIDKIKENIDENGFLGENYQEAVEDDFENKFKELYLEQNSNSVNLYLKTYLDDDDDDFIQDIFKNNDIQLLSEKTFEIDDITYTIEKINLNNNFPELITEDGITKTKFGSSAIILKRNNGKAIKCYFAKISYIKNDVKHNAIALISNEESNISREFTDKTKYTENQLASNHYRYIPTSIQLSNTKIIYMLDSDYGYIYKKDNAILFAQTEPLQSGNDTALGLKTSEVQRTIFLNNDVINIYNENENYDNPKYYFTYNNQKYYFDEDSLKIQFNSSYAPVKTINVKEQFFENFGTIPCNNYKILFTTENHPQVISSVYSNYYLKTINVTTLMKQSFADTSNLEINKETFKKYIYGYGIVNSNVAIKGNKILINSMNVNEEGEEEIINSGYGYTSDNEEPVMNINISSNKINDLEEKDTNKLIVDNNYKEEATSFALTIETSDNYNDPYYYVLSFTTNYDLWSTPTNYIKTTDSDSNNIIYYYDGTDEDNRTVSNKKVPYLTSTCKTSNINSNTYLFNENNKKNGIVYNLNYNFDSNIVKINSLVGSANYSLKIYNIFGQFIKEIEFTTPEDLTYNPYGKFFAQTIDGKDNPNYLTLDLSTNSDEYLLSREYIPASFKQLLYSAGSEAVKKYVKADGTQYNIRDQFRLKIEEKISNIQEITLKFNFELPEENNHGIKLEIDFNGNGKKVTYKANNADSISIPYDDIKSILNRYNTNGDLILSKEELENFIEQEIIIKGKITATNVPTKNQNVNIVACLSYKADFIFLDLNQDGYLTTRISSDEEKYNYRNFDGYAVNSENSNKYDLGMKAGTFEITSAMLRLDGTYNPCYMPQSIGDTINKYYDGFVFVKNGLVGYLLYAYSNKEQGKIIS